MVFVEPNESRVYPRGGINLSVLYLSCSNTFNPYVCRQANLFNSNDLCKKYIFQTNSQQDTFLQHLRLERAK